MSIIGKKILNSPAERREGMIKDDKCYFCGYPYDVHKSATKQCPADDAYQPASKREWLNTRFSLPKGEK